MPSPRSSARTAPLAIFHQDQFPSVTISFNLAPGASLSDAVSAIGKAQQEIGMPSSVVGNYSGDADEFTRSLAGQPWLILAAIITIYIVLGVLYESFVHPFTILTTLPSAGIGAVLALMLCGTRSVTGGADRHRAVDGHREKERHHDDRLRAGGGTHAKPQAPRGHRAGLAVAVSADYDDDARCPVRCATPGARERYRLGAAKSAGHHHYWWPVAQSAVDALYDARDLSRHGARAGAAGAELQALPHRQVPLGKPRNRRR